MQLPTIFTCTLFANDKPNKVPFPFADRLEKGCSLRTVRGAESRILNITTRENRFAGLSATGIHLWHLANIFTRKNEKLAKTKSKMYNHGFRQGKESNELYKQNISGIKCTG